MRASYHLILQKLLTLLLLQLHNKENSSIQGIETISSLIYQRTTEGPSSAGGRIEGTDAATKGNFHIDRKWEKGIILPQEFLFNLKGDFQLVHLWTAAGAKGLAVFTFILNKKMETHVWRLLKMLACLNNSNLEMNKLILIIIIQETTC
ncbi:hypothetical protein ACJX0J_030069 [Zea mays]